MSHRLRLLLITAYILTLPIIIYFFHDFSVIIICSVLILIAIGYYYWGFLGTIVTSSLSSGIITIDYFYNGDNLYIVLVVIGLNLLMNIIFGLNVLINDFLVSNDTLLSETMGDLQEAREQFSILTRAIQDGIIIINNYGAITYWNEAAHNIFGYKAEEIINKPWYKLVDSTGNYEAFVDAIDKFHNPEESFGLIEKLQIDCIDKAGNNIPVEVTISAIKVKDTWKAVVVIKNITERIEAEKNINRLVNYDCLTELPNRVKFNEIIEYNIAKHQRAKNSFAILILDLNKFKTVNDSFGHKFGDLLLIEVANRLKEFLIEDNRIFRFGGDEFVILLTDITDQQTIIDFINIIMKQFITAFEIQGLTIFTSVSIGISVYPDDGLDCMTLVRSADMAMYYAKKFGHGNYKFYNQDMHKRELERLSLHNDLQFALQRNEFVLYYQPQIDINTDEVIGVEALLRWEHPEYGLVAPFKFIPIAEETGAIIEIGKWVLSAVCQHMKSWQNKGLKPMPVAINISIKEFQNAKFVDTVISCLEENQINANLIELEITETVAMHDVGYVISTLKKLKAIGIKVAIDDFGTGFSSLSVLKNLPIDRLKIDRSFINDIDKDEKDLAIVQTFINLAKKLDLTVIAEGVETNIQKQHLIESNCDYIQGYLFSKPISEKDIQKYF